MTFEPKPVREVLLDRLASGSRPGARKDGYRVVLAVEGGGMRGAVSSGMLLVLEQLGLRDSVDEVVGTSAGAIAGAFFVIGKGTAGSSLFYRVLNSERFMSRRRLLGDRPVLDLDYLLDEAVTDFGFDWDDLVNSDIPLWATVTPTSEEDPSRMFRVGLSHLQARQVLAATAALPVMAGPSRLIGSRHYVDGGLLEAVPWVSALRRNATHVLVIRSRGFNVDGRIEEHSFVERVSARRFVSRMHGEFISQVVNRSTERFWNGTEALRAIIEGDASPVAGGGRNVGIDVVQPHEEAILPERLELDSHVLLDALTAGAQAMLDYLALEGFAVEQRVVVTHPRAPVGRVRTMSLRPIVADRRQGPR